MAMQWLDSFDGYGGTVSHLLDGLYTDNAFAGLATVPAPPAGTYVLNLNLDGANLIRRPFATPSKKFGCGARYWFPNMPASNNQQTYVASFNDNTNTVCARFFITTTGGIEVRNSDSTLLVASTGPIVTANAWNHIECYVEVATGGVGVVDVYVNNIRKIHNTGLTMVNNVNIAQIAHGRAGGGGGAGFYMKDYYTYDTTGSFNNASGVGDIQVAAETITANGAVQDWTASTGTAFSCVQSIAPDDTKWISHDATALPKQSNFPITALPAEATAVKAVQVRSRQWKSDAGTSATTAGILSVAAQGSGASNSITTVPTFYEDIFETDPNTSAAWNPVAVNASQVTIKRTA